MKLTIIAFSLVANLFLAGLIAFPKSAGRILSFARPGADAAATGTTGQPSAASTAASGAKLAVPAPGTPLTAEGAQRFAEQARAAGMPTAMIRALLQAQSGEAVSARRKELVTPVVPPPYWKLQIAPVSTLTPQAQSELRMMNQAATRIINDLLGPDPFAIVSPYEKLQYGNLPADKVDQLKLVVQDYNELANAVRTMGVLLPEDRAKLAFYDEEKDKDIRALLAPAEYDEYQLRSSNTANNMRSNLALFEPTEAEFRNIFALQQAFDKKFNSGIGQLPPEIARERQPAQQQLNADIKAALDPVRATEYEMSTDFNYKNTMQIVSRLDLPKQAAATVWQTQKDAQAQVVAIRGAGLPMDARIAQFTEVQAKATATIQQALGDRGFDNYKQSAGQWLNNLVPTVNGRGAAPPAVRGAAAPVPRGAP